MKLELLVKSILSAPPPIRKQIESIIERSKVGLRRKSAKVKADKFSEIMPGAEAARLLGISIRTLEYHAAKGRVRRVKIPGSSRSRGYLASDIYAILKGNAK